MCLLTKCCWFCKYLSSVLNGLPICGLFASAELLILQKIKYTPRCLQNQSLILQSPLSFVKQYIKTLFLPWPKKYVWGMCVWATAAVLVDVIATLQLSMHFLIIPSDSVGRQPCSLCLVCLMPYFKLTAYNIFILFILFLLKYPALLCWCIVFTGCTLVTFFTLYTIGCLKKGRLCNYL